MSVRVIVTTRSGAQVPGRTDDLGASDGLVYVALDSGGQGSFPAERVALAEDKDYPQAGMETK